MDRETYPNSRVVDLAGKLIPVKLNTDRQANMAIARRYGVESIPTLVFTDASGKRLHQFIGFRAPEDFVREMQTALKKAKK